MSEEGLLYKKMKDEASEIQDSDMESGASYYMKFYLLPILDLAKADWEESEQKYRIDAATDEVDLLQFKWAWFKKWFGGENIK